MSAFAKLVAILRASLQRSLHALLIVGVACGNLVYLSACASGGSSAGSSGARASDADLVTLSACQAGLGETVRGEGMAGLTRAFLHAGAPSVLVSLWSVNELTTAHLMKEFYTRLREGLSKAEALRGARSAMAGKKTDLGPLERGGGKADAPPAKSDRRLDASHPFYWAAFVLAGSPD